MLHLVHIPKTGGTALSTLPYVKRHDHFQRLSDVPDPAIVVLRDPVARFRSSFDMVRSQRHVFGTLDEFIDDLDEHLSHDWPGHTFYPQTWWVDEPDGRDLIVLRTEWLDDLYGDLLPGIGSIRRNESRPKWSLPPPIWWSPSTMTKAHEALIRRRYADDYDLLEKLCSLSRPRSSMMTHSASSPSRSADPSRRPSRPSAST